VADKDLTGLDRWILGEFTKLEAEVMGDNGAYYNYEFHVVYQKLSQFIAVELSSVYHDVIKDRLYTDAANSPRRRSTQTALHRLVSGLCQMLAPILAFTADEAWEFVPGKPTGSVHESEFKRINFALSESEQTDWKVLFETRVATLPELEKARQSKAIGKSLDAKVELLGYTDNSLETQFRYQNELRELLNVSQIGFAPAPLKQGVDAWIPPIVKKADGQKCERCWHWETDIGQNSEHPTICGRCVKAVTI
jgi:isoleucyl-tRNA synthetase